MALTNTITHAKFQAMRMKLGIPAAWLLGHLEMYWQYCHTHGHTMPYEHVEFAAGWSEAFPDRYDEFITAAMEWGWIDCNDDGTVSAHDYMANAPRFVKERERVKNWRQNKNASDTQVKRGVRNCNAIVQDVTPCNDDVMPCNAVNAIEVEVDIEVDVDKEPKEVLLYDFATQNPTPAPKIRKPSAKSETAPAFSAGFLAVWKSYPHYGGRSSKAKAWDKWKAMRLDTIVKDGDVIIYSPEKVLAWVEHLKTSADWQKQDGQFVPALQVWLGNRIWTNGEPPVAEKKELACEWETE